MRWALTVIGFATAVALLCAPWGGSKGGAIMVVGSTSVQPFAEMLAGEFAKRPDGFTVNIQGGGSTVGVRAAENGMADIGTCSRGLKPQEKLQPIAIAQDGLAIVVYPSNPVAGLSVAEVRQIFAGEITRWNQVGGPDKPIRLITREEGSGTREAFENLVMHDKAAEREYRISRKALTQESNGAVHELVKHDPCAVGYMSLGLVGNDLKALHVDGAEPTVANVVDKKYKLVRPFLFVTKGKPSDKAQKFIDYVLSDNGQRLLMKEGLVPAVSRKEKP